MVTEWAAACGLVRECGKTDTLLYIRLYRGTSPSQLWIFAAYPLDIAFFSTLFSTVRWLLPRRYINLHQFSIENDTILERFCSRTHWRISWRQKTSYISPTTAGSTHVTDDEVRSVIRQSKLERRSMEWNRKTGGGRRKIEYAGEKGERDNKEQYAKSLHNDDKCRLLWQVWWLTYSFTARARGRWRRNVSCNSVSGQMLAMLR